MYGDESRENKCHQKGTRDETNDESVPSFFVKYVGESWNLAVERIDKPYIVTLTLRLARHLVVVNFAACEFTGPANARVSCVSVFLVSTVSGELDRARRRTELSQVC